jgi:hypothetical protein
MDDNNLDDLELELRMLPGVRAAGFDPQDDVLFVQLHMADSPAEPETMSATRIAARHAADRSVAVEIARWRTYAPPVAVPAEMTDDDVSVDLSSDLPLVPQFAPLESPGAGTDATDRKTRPRLLAVLVFPDTDELEVHLIHDGRRTIGRAPASRGLVGAAEATIDAIRGLGAPIAPCAKWARVLDSNGDGRELVAVAVTADADEPTLNYGLAAGASAIDAAARSTLDALNRRLARVL